VVPTVTRPTSSPADDPVNSRLPPARRLHICAAAGPCREGQDAPGRQEGTSMSPSYHPVSRHRYQRRPIARACAIAAAAALSALASSPAAGAQAAALPAPACSAHTLPVRIADPGPAGQALWGQLCYRGTHEPGTVQLLVHGATYNHRYWDFPYGDGYYSYVDAATAAGYATFNVDRIGDGNSSHPPSAGLDLTAGAVALHDAVTALRSGAVDGHPFQHVIIVGHSIGSVEVWIEAARYHDVNAVIVTAALHALSPDIGALQADLYPAADDPAFAGSGLDPGYLTTLPGTRGSLFYNPATANPAVVAADEANKDTATPAELGGAAAIISGPPAQQPSYQIDVPVLSVVGENDNLFCTGVAVYNCAHPGTVQAFESQYYSPAAHLKVAVIPDAGHDLALSTTAPLTDAIMIGWALAATVP
jgi:pimeloyl-ACP methyl ester carboxylesterase